ncbi:hypothetical protein BDW02DRAFT_566034 [Decorospora gaudefroyi]|uniref:Uncharacterized protein n=1 Tax=Decorospora gaudefroyi TaxID=184978 RepID=A0A6A5KQL5_9PLEO|nr:hypothetical protein BDW02DRAFT_566034 [Decorospora gaudefroyi]
MEQPSPPKNANMIPTATSGSRSKLLSKNIKEFLGKPALAHPQKALTVQLWNAEHASDGNADQKEHVAGEGRAAGVATDRNAGGEGR